MSSAKASDSGKSNRNQRVWGVVQRIPEGTVATYKQIAILAKISGPSGARQVGYALAQTPEDLDIPWHRVINSKGSVSPRANPDSVSYQRELLEQEGIEFDLYGNIDLAIFGWKKSR